MEKINIAKLLKNCPQGTKLYSPMCGECTLDSVDNSQYAITVRAAEDLIPYYLTADGRYLDVVDAECVLFPSKDQRDWSKFQRPFKDGDIVVSLVGNPFILKFYDLLNNNVHSYCGVDCNNGFHLSSSNWTFAAEIRHADEEEKQKLFNAIKENGYRWNAETKTLEKLVKPEFNVGDWIIRNNKYTGIPVKVIEFNGYYSCELNGEIVNLTLNDVHNNFHLWTIDDAKAGDVLFHSDSASNGIFIFNEIVQRGLFQKVICYCDYDSEDGFCLGENHTCCYTNSKILCPATKEQCDLLFSKMKEMGYKWVDETKTLEKLVELKFKDGDIIADKHGNIAIYKGTMWYNKKLAGYYCGYRKSDNHFLPEPKRDSHFGLIEELHYATEEEKQKLFDIIRENGYSWNSETKTLEKLCTIFKVGDKIKLKNAYAKKYDDFNTREITEIKDSHYILDDEQAMPLSNQYLYELVPNKFDINTLKAFDKVLVRLTKDGVWCATFFSHYDKEVNWGCYPFVTTSSKSYSMCIPYEGNEHLRGTRNDCDNFYKIWE